MSVSWTSPSMTIANPFVQDVLVMENGHMKHQNPKRSHNFINVCSPNLSLGECLLKIEAMGCMGQLQWRLNDFIWRIDKLRNGTFIWRPTHWVDMKVIGSLSCCCYCDSVTHCQRWSLLSEPSSIEVPTKAFWQIILFHYHRAQAASSLYCAQRVFAVCQNEIAAPSVGCGPFNLSQSKEKKKNYDKTRDRAGSRLSPNNNFVELVDWSSRFQCVVCGACYPLLAILLKLLLCSIIIMYEDFISLQRTLCILAKWNISVGFLKPISNVEEAKRLRRFAQTKHTWKSFQDPKKKSISRAIHLAFIVRVAAAPATAAAEPLVGCLSSLLVGNEAYICFFACSFISSPFLAYQQTAFLFFCVNGNSFWVYQRLKSYLICVGLCI